MGSSRRRVPSPTSPSSSYSALWGRCDESRGKEVGVGRIRQGAERFTVEDEREVARRVLEDLEGLYFDGSSDDESEDEDEVSSISEWGSDTSSRSSSGKRKAGGMSLEELTVALNAAIEFHRPAQLSNSMKESKREADEQCGQRSNKRHQRSRSRCQEKESSIASSPRGEPTMEFFQDMLERKQQHFYAMQTAPAPEEEIIEEDRQSQRSVWSHHTDTANREKRITTLVRDQATETEEYFQYPRFDTSFGVADFQTPPDSLPRSARLRNMQIANELPITIGPTLADLAASKLFPEAEELNYSATDVM
ncbi:hypothetical protein PF010_g20729 [Phytophthora fragariae]|uniref:Uncharacterized protein n=1 Tax=Phytophthora fragariae TaxID=53985 RepID=A0A6G0KEC8_9STRA|nr:hypothetical protein PF010_g20729 [Phytophthora fragariae]